MTSTLSQRPADTAQKFTRDVEETYIDLLRQGFPRRMAAREVEITIRTVNRRIEADPEFAQEVLDAEREAVEGVEATLLRMAMSAKDFQATKFFLINRGKDRWASENKIEVSGPDGGAIKVEHEIPPEIWQAAIQTLIQLDAEVLEIEATETPLEQIPGAPSTNGETTGVLPND